MCIAAYDAKSKESACQYRTCSHPSGAREERLKSCKKETSAEGSFGSGESVGKCENRLIFVRGEKSSQGFHKRPEQRVQPVVFTAASALSSQRKAEKLIHSPQQNRQSRAQEEEATTKCKCWPRNFMPMKTVAREGDK